MYFQSSLIRMMILTTCILIALIVFSIRMSDKLIYKSNDPVYAQYFSWSYQNRTYSLLLHSVHFNDTIFSAYSKVSDSLMTFPAKQADIGFINNLMRSFSFETDACVKCHQSN